MNFGFVVNGAKTKQFPAMTGHVEHAGSISGVLPETPECPVLRLIFIFSILERVSDFKKKIYNLKFQKRFKPKIKITNFNYF